MSGKSRPPAEGVSAVLSSRPETEAGVVAALALEGARKEAKIINDDSGRRWLIVPEGLTINEITDEHGIKSPRSRIQQKPVFYEKAAFIEYVNRFKTDATVVFNNTDENYFDAFLDYHPATEKKAVLAGTNEHVARLQLRYSEQFARWDKVEGNWIEQVKFAEFLEENYIDVKQPAGAVVLELAHDLEARKHVRWKSAIRRDTQTRAFEYEEDLQANAKGKGEVVVPRDLLFALPIYQGEAAMEVTAFLRHNLVQGTLAFKLDWYRIVFIKLAVQTLLATEVREHCGVPVFVGVPAARS